jgi:HlyD family secretion protein
MKRALFPVVAMALVTSILLGCAANPDGLAMGGQQNRTTNNALELSGTIEAREVTIASEVGGRVIELAVDEGDSVDAGDLLVRLDDALMREQRAQAIAAVDEARAAIAGAEAQLALALAGARSEEIDRVRNVVRAAEANVILVNSLEKIAELRVEAARSEVDAAQAQLAAVQAQLAGSQSDLAQVQAHRTKGVAGATAEEITIAERQVERAKNELWAQQSLRDSVCGMEQKVGGVSCDAAQAQVLAAEEMVNIAEAQLQRTREGLRDEELAALTHQVGSAAAGVDGARARVGSARAQLATAETMLASAQADVQSASARVDAAMAERDQAQAVLELIMAGARSEEIDGLRAGVARAQAALATAEAAVRTMDVRISQLTLTTPMRGEVLHAMIHLGELARAGAPLLTLVDLQRLTLTVYVPQVDLGRVALGQRVDVSVDAYEQAFPGRVTYIASRAEFTPSHVETKEERVKMVFAVKITLDNADLLLKPGMPADVTFR